MAKLVVTADIHGSLNGWKRIKKLLKSGDSLAIAGDLFDTRYGSGHSADFKPDIIRKDFLNLSEKSVKTYYVYGNCDQEDYFKGFFPQLFFEFDGLPILLNHGHLHAPDLSDVQILIEGHSHIPRLDTMFGKIFLNPGSPSRPRNSVATYAVIENKRICIMDMIRNKVIADLSLNPVP